MIDTSHLVNLRQRLADERQRYATEPTTLRRVFLDQAEREIAAEERFLGLDDSSEASDLDDDALLAELFS